ncbi:MAG: PAS domain-containing protein [Acidobacteria bacterium]|nr:PAS domain-containing protein [Acidobacteriota bacterium]MBV9477419.1 PAS domain-containing protein [Acidobacteriota bacterium]
MPVFIVYRADDGQRVADWLNDSLQGRTVVVSGGTSRESFVLSVRPGSGVPAARALRGVLDLGDRTPCIWLLVCTPGAMHEFTDDDLYRSVRWWVDRGDLSPILILPAGARWIPEIVLAKWPSPLHVDLAPNAPNLTQAERDYIGEQAIQQVIAAVRSTLQPSAETHLVARVPNSFGVAGTANIPDIYTWAKDTSLRYIAANERYAQAAGFDSPAAMLGKTDDVMPWRALAPFFQAGDRQVISGNAPPRVNVQETEIMVDRMADILVTERPLFDASGRCIGLQGFFVDISGQIMVPRSALGSGAAQGLSLGPLFGNEQLSSEEVQVLKGMLSLQSPDLIATHTNLARAVVVAHMKTIRQKLQCSNDNDVITAAIRSGLPLALFGPTFAVPAGPRRTSYLDAEPQPNVVTSADDVPGADSAYAFSGTASPELAAYADRIIEGWSGLPVCRSLDHTMYRALNDYVHRKVPADDIKDVITRGGQIEVHGVFPDDVSQVAVQHGWGSLVPLESEQSHQSKAFNHIRPVFFRRRNPGAPDGLLVCVTPGHDYVMHYASLVRYIVFEETTHADERISIIRYPLAERRLPTRTGLGAHLVDGGDSVLLGYVEPIKQYLDDARWATQVRAPVETPYYGSYRYSLPGGRFLTLLGVRYSYWGSISEEVVRAVCELGAREVLYVGKLGALTSPEDLYSRMFCPSEYLLLQHDRVVHAVTAPRNGVLALFPHLDSGCHVSVPTVLEEDYNQRDLSAKLTANSIDNEISRMANAVATHNRMEDHDVSFSALHFATDYIRGPNERDREVSFDLSVNRSSGAREAKVAVLTKICEDVLSPYFRAGDEAT